MTFLTPIDTEPEPTGDLRQPDRGRRWLVAIAAVVVLIALAVVLVFSLTGDDADDRQTADVGQQGRIDEPMAADAASLERRADGLSVEVAIPTPEPGSYEYPAADDLAPGTAPHPPVGPGGDGAPEAFTLWMFVFNDPTSCTDSQCDVDDFAPGAAARGGVFQIDGRLGDADELSMGGNLRLGQPAITGEPLDDPVGAEVHIAIAPHGRALAGADLIRQLNGPLGNPTLWWGASFVVR